MRISRTVKWLDSQAAIEGWLDPGPIETTEITVTCAGGDGRRTDGGAAVTSTRRVVPGFAVGGLLALGRLAPRGRPRRPDVAARRRREPRSRQRQRGLHPARRGAGRAVAALDQRLRRRRLRQGAGGRNQLPARRQPRPRRLRRRHVRPGGQLARRRRVDRRGRAGSSNGFLPRSVDIGGRPSFLLKRVNRRSAVSPRTGRRDGVRAGAAPAALRRGTGDDTRAVRRAGVRPA